MKDTADTSTGELLKSPGARRQAEYRKRKQAAGMSQRLVWVEDKAWQAGFDAGLAKQPNACPDGLDGLSWISGYIEGKAKAYPCA